MIVRRVRVHPFGCFEDREVAFTPGLNVILGPNEAGKSTLFNAVKCSFLRTKLTKQKFAQFIEEFLPAGGGDIVRLELEFTAAAAKWVLKRRWGQAPASELTGQGSGTLGDDDAIAEKLESLLPAKQGTFWKVLMTGQAELASTLDSLRKEGREALADLTDMLRRAVLATGGVPVDRFLGLLETRRDEAFSRWDRARGGPEGNRGMENPWINKIGSILQSWYEWERIRASGKSAAVYETGMDAINARLRTVAADLAGRDAFVSRNTTAARDARERRTLEAELKAVRQEAESLRRISIEWPVAMHKMKELEQALAEGNAARGPLEAELHAAQRAEDTRGLREKLARVLKREAQAADARGKLAALPRVDKKALEEIRAAAMALEKLQAGVEAGRLRVTMVGKGGAELVVQEDFDPESRTTLGPGETVRLRAGGRVRIVHPDMEIEVQSGDQDASARVEKAAAARRVVEALLVHHGVPDLAEAEKRCRVYEAAVAEAEAAEKNLMDELAGQPLADITTRVAALGAAEQTRPLATIASTLATLNAQGKAQSSDLSGIRRQVREWESALGTPEKLLDKLAEAKGQENHLVDTVTRSAPLPEGYANAETFLRDFESAQKKLADLRVELKGLEGNKNALMDKAPDQSAEELVGQVRDAEAAFRAELRRGEALQRIDAVARSLLGEGATAIYDGVRAELEKLTAAMTGGRHLWVEMDGSLPRALADGRGMSIGWELLSAGTKDTLALALRLAMAEYFLGDSDGFMMMDDPLVDMDPTRRKAAAQCLVSFGSARQLILFTCHPTTAELLGGNLIRL